MQTKSCLNVATALLSLSTLISQPSNGLAQGTAFTYQGRLTDDANAANGSYDLRFMSLAATVGTASSPGHSPIQLQRSATACSPSRSILATACSTVPIGGCEIAVRTNGVSAFGPLTPRQQTQPTPYANTRPVTTTVPPGVTGTKSNAVTLDNAGNSFAATARVDGANASQ